jgi:hypothetical protein
MFVILYQATGSHTHTETTTKIHASGADRIYVEEKPIEILTL